MSNSRSSKSLSSSSSPDSPSRVLTGQYLEQHSSKNDLLRRLRTIVQTLRDEEDLEHDHYPGLDSLARLVASQKYLEHKDKEVRLYTVLVCVEVFYVYAPDPPFDEQETILFFAQMIRQLGNLAHCISPKQPNYMHYFHLLEQLATLRFGLVLVELCRTLDDNQEALDTLQELLRTLLSVVHIDHPQQVYNHASSAIASILEEFDLAIPIPILDEVLMAIATGPVVMVTNPAAVEAAAKLSARKKKGSNDDEASKLKSMPPSQIQQTNPSYMVAANAIRKVGEKVASPISAFLNGLWNGDAIIVDQSSISTDDTNPNVWSTIYELHKIAPQILTTVIGTVASSLTAPEEDVRCKVVKLLGRLFYSPNSQIGNQFRPCFREWLRRHVDVSNKVRTTMVKYLVTILAQEKTELMEETMTTLQNMLTADPDVAVRISAIHQVCDLAYKSPHLISSVSLLKAVGERVSSKHKIERKDSLTGLAQIYHKHYILPKLAHVQSGGDDCVIDIVIDALHGGNTEMLEDKYGWIAAKALECASFRDDVEMQNRVHQIVDDILLGRGVLSGTSRAVGMAIVVESLGKPSNAHAWMVKLFSQRAALQKALSKYLDARSLVRQSKAGTEQSLTANAHAVECLENIAALTGGLTNDHDRLVLDKLHTARDNHIFKILSTIADPTHTSAARTRALDELPKRTKSLGDETAAWIRTLVRRTAMGNFVNMDNVHHVILLAQECVGEGDFDGCRILLSCLKSIADVFPLICASKEDFGNLLELFAQFREVSNHKAREKIKQLELITTLSSIVAAASQASKVGGMDDEVQEQLLNLCTRDGTPEQAQHAVQTIAALLVDENADTSSQVDAFAPLLKALTSPSRLNLSLASGSSKLIGALAALSALAGRMPILFDKSGRGYKAVRFAFETVLLGRTESYDDIDASVEDDATVEIDTITTPRKRRKSNQSPGVKNFLEDEDLSVSCRRTCAAIEFLVTRIRSAIIAKRLRKLDIEGPSMEHIGQIFSILHQMLHDKGLPPSSQDRRDCRSRQDRAALRECVSVQFFRLCDTRLQLVDSHLTIPMWHTLSASLLDEEKRVRETVMSELGMMLTGKGPYAQDGFPQPANLRFLAMLVFCVDSDGNSIANGNAANVGKACHAVKAAAKIGIIGLRQTTEATLNQCRAVGKEAEKKFDLYLKRMIMPEYSVPFAIHLLSLRRETPMAGGIVAGMPGATQLVGGDPSDEQIDDIDDAAHQRVLRKRLKMLFEPLVLSLGDGADNITFLLRMTEMIGNQFQPRDIKSATSFVFPASSDESLASPVVRRSDETEASTLFTARMKTTCSAARDVLLTFVKKDVNLTPYPGQIEVPTSVFQKLSLSSIKAASREYGQSSSPDNRRLVNRSSLSSARTPSMRKENNMDVDGQHVSKGEENSVHTRHNRSRRGTRQSIDTTESASSNEGIKKRLRSSVDSFSSATNTFIPSQDSRELNDYDSAPSMKKSKVTFSPEVIDGTQKGTVGSSQSPTSFGGVSPIIMSDSPGSLGSSNSKQQSDTQVAPAARTRGQNDAWTEELPQKRIERGVVRSRLELTPKPPKQLLSSQESDAATTPETQSSFEEMDSPEVPKRSKSTLSGKLSRPTRVSTKKSPGKSAPLKIRVALTQNSTETAARSRSSSRNRMKRVPAQTEEDDFEFTDDKENNPQKAKKANASSKGQAKDKARNVKGGAMPDRTDAVRTSRRLRRR